MMIHQLNQQYKKCLKALLSSKDILPSAHAKYYYEEDRSNPQIAGLIHSYQPGSWMEPLCLSNFDAGFQLLGGN